MKVLRIFALLILSASLSIVSVPAQSAPTGIGRSISAIGIISLFRAVFYPTPFIRNGK